MGEVHKLVPVEVGKGYRFDHDEMLEAAKGKGFGRLAIVGDLPDGTIRISGSANSGGARRGPERPVRGGAATTSGLSDTET